MKNNRLLFCVIFVIVFAVFNVVVFQLPIDRTEIFWITYGFTCVAFAILFAVWHRCFFLDETPKSRFLGFGITYVATYYFVAQLVLFVIVLGVPDIKKWLVIILNTLLLGLTMIFISFTQMGKNYAKSIDIQNRDQVLFTKGIVMKLEILKQKLNQEEKNRLEKLIELVKYSDPISNRKCQEVESQIMNKLYILENIDDKLSVMEEMKMLFEERNQKIKLWK